MAVLPLMWPGSMSNGEGTASPLHSDISKLLNSFWREIEQLSSSHYLSHASLDYLSHASLEASAQICHVGATYFCDTACM